MSKVKEVIEEIIEESYLMGLSAEEIRRDFKRFIDTCYTVIEENVRECRDVSRLTENLAREKTYILIADRSGAEGEVALRDDGTSKSASEVFAEKVARRKRHILKIIAQYDPQLVRLIDAHRFQGELSPPARGFERSGWNLGGRFKHERLRLQLLRFAYILTIALIVVLLYLGFIQKP